MKGLESLKRFAVLSALCALPLAMGGCGDGSGGDAKHATVTVGTMPQGAEWAGVYYSELYGYLHLVSDGGGVNGRWLRPTKNKCGEVKGTVDGDVLKFTWTEHVVGAVGPNSSSTGHGYFKYKRPEGDNVDDTIVGEVGKGSDEVGVPWDAVKQRNVVPDPKSIACGGGAVDLGGGDWDKSNAQPGTPEPPKSPSIPQP
jgi:hypothetical protein